MLAIAGQVANAHSSRAFSDFLSEQDTFYSSRPLVDFLHGWQSKTPSFFGRILELSSKMAAKGFWGSEGTCRRQEAPNRGI